MSQDLIHRRTRKEFRELASDWGVLQRIADAFEVEAFVRGDAVNDISGQRRCLFEGYANEIDWTDSGQVSRAIHVFEEILSWQPVPPNEQSEKALARVATLLGSDGYEIDSYGRINRTGARFNDLPLDTLLDPQNIEEHLRRLDTIGQEDPALAISSSKAIIEATCKHVLEEVGVEYDEKADIPALVKATQKALKVHPESIAPTAKGRETIVRILANLSQVAIGVAELRNEYGPDHGRTRSTTGLGPRHAHLAIGGSQTFCRFVLETLRDRRQ